MIIAYIFLGLFYSILTFLVGVEVGKHLTWKMHNEIMMTFINDVTKTIREELDK